MRRHSFRKRRLRVMRSEVDSEAGASPSSLLRATPSYRPVKIGLIEAQFGQLAVNRPLSLPKYSSGPLYQIDSTALDVELVDEGTGHLAQGQKVLRLCTDSPNRTIKEVRIFPG